MHPSGHQSVFETADGGVVLAGQVIYSKAEYEHLHAANTVFEDDPPPDPEQYLASAAPLMHPQPRRVHLSHAPQCGSRSANLGPELTFRGSFRQGSKI
jgi:hypothetical protein